MTYITFLAYISCQEIPSLKNILNTKVALRHPSHERMLLHPSTYCHSRSDSMAKAASKMRNMVKSLSMSNVSNLTNSRNWDLKNFLAVRGLSW